MESIIYIIGIIVLAVLALKFLGGIVKKVVSLALFVLGAAFVYNWLTGGDIFGIVGYVTGFLP